MNRKLVGCLVLGSIITAGVANPAKTTKVYANPMEKGNVQHNDAIKMGEVIAHGGLNVRNNDEANTIIGTLLNSSKIKILGEENGKYKIDFNGKDGYVAKKYVKILSESKKEEEEKNKTKEIKDIKKEVKEVKKNEVKNSDKSDAKHEIEKNNDQSNKSLGQGITTASWLNIRNGASTSNSIVGTIPRDSKVSILNKESNGWYKIKFKNIEGYASGQYIKDISLTSSETIIKSSWSEEKKSEQKETKSSSTNLKERAGIIQVHSTLNIRQKPTTNSVILGELHNNDKVTIIGEEKGFYQVKYGHVYAYVSKDYVKDTETTSSKTEESNVKKDSGISTKNDSSTMCKEGVINVHTSLNIRQKPSVSSAVLGKLHNNEKVTITGEDNGFYKIKYGTAYAYISKDYVKDISTIPNKVEDTSNKKENELSSKDNNANINKEGSINVGSSLNIRQKATTYSNVIGSLGNGEKVVIVGEEGQFYKIKHGSSFGFVSKDYVNIIGDAHKDKPSSSPIIDSKNKEKDTVNNIGVVRVNSYLNVRETPKTNCRILGELTNGQTVKIKSEENDFYKIDFNGKEGFVSKKYIDIGKGDTVDCSGIQESKDSKYIYTNYNFSEKEYIKLQQKNNPTDYSEDFIEKYVNPKKAKNQYQFLTVDTYRDADAAGLNNKLRNAGVLSGQGQAFLNAARKYNLDPVFLVSQSIHETGYGSSRLAKGVTISCIANENKPIYRNGRLVGYEMIPLSHPVTVYNLFGIGAQDNTRAFSNRALILGTTYAYNKGWTSVPRAIEGAGEFLSRNYVHSEKYKQNTLYKMRYNQNKENIWHQYATTPWYASEIGDLMGSYKNLYRGAQFTFDVPNYVSYKLNNL